MPGDIAILTITITNTAEAGHAAETEVRRVIHTPPLITTEEKDKRVTPINARIRSITLREDRFEVINGKYNTSLRNGYNIHTREISFPVEVIDHPGIRLASVKHPLTVRRGEIAMIELEVMNARITAVECVRVITVTDILITPTEAFVGAMGPGEIFSTRLEVDAAYLNPRFRS